MPKPQIWRKVKRQETWMIPPNQVRSPRTPLGRLKENPTAPLHSAYREKSKSKRMGPGGLQNPTSAKRFTPPTPLFNEHFQGREYQSASSADDVYVASTSSLKRGAAS